MAKWENHRDKGHYSVFLFEECKEEIGLNEFDALRVSIGFGVILLILLNIIFLFGCYIVFSESGFGSASNRMQ